MNYKELSKLFPEVKILAPEHSEYYVETLLRAKVLSEKNFNSFKDLCSKYDKPGSYKMSLLDKILNYFKENNYDLSTLTLPEMKYTEKDFSDFKESKFYISIDLKQGNWQIFNSIFNLREDYSWEEFLKEKFGAHEAICNSKSFRQLVFGNTNPKRIQYFQKIEMQKIYELICSTSLKETIVGKKSDELILEIDSDWYGRYLELEELLKGFRIKISAFKVSIVRNRGDVVKVKTDLNSFVTSFIGVSGLRYFIHLKDLILQEEIDERDLLFLVEEKLAKWIL